MIRCISDGDLRAEIIYIGPDEAPDLIQWRLVDTSWNRLCQGQVASREQACSMMDFALAPLDPLESLASKLSRVLVDCFDRGIAAIRDLERQPKVG